MRHQNFVAVYLLARHQGKIALSGRQNTGFFDQHFGLISGHVEDGESFTQAMIREAREEAGLELQPKNLRVVHVLHNTRAKTPDDNDQYVSVFFAVDLVDPLLENREPEKCFDIAWFALEDLPENTIPYIKQVILDVEAGKIYSEKGWL